MLQDADVARRDIDNTAGYEERRHLARAALQHFLVRVFNRLYATHAGAHCYADRVTILFGDFEAGVSDCIHGRGNAVVDEWIHLASLFGRHIVANVEVLDRTAYSGWKLTGIKVVNKTNSRHTIADVVPGIIQLIANRRDYSHSGNDDASFFQCVSD